MLQQRIGVVQPPRAHDVAGAQQLGADRVGHEDLACEHAVEHQQADVVGAGAREPQGVPWPFVERVHDDLEIALRGGEPIALEQLAELGVEVQDLGELAFRHDLFYGH